jgi:chromosome segregation ATPase
MTTHTEEQNLLTRVAELDSEIEELERRKDEALGVISRAHKRFEELDEYRRQLSPRAFSGDSDASSELEAIEDEYETLCRSVRVANSAVPEFERMLEEAKAQRRETQESVHRERYRILLEERSDLDVERDELGRRLCEVLEKRGLLDSQIATEIRHWDNDQANNHVLLSMGANQDWLTEEFRAWLPGGSYRAHEQSLAR